MKRWAMIFTLVLAAVPAAMAFANGPVIVPDVVYGHKDGMALTYDVVKPSSDANGAAVMFMVSGGWFSRWSPPEQYAEQFKLLLDRGYTLYLVRHGSAPRFKVPEAVEDVKLAVRHIRANAEKHDIDSNRLGVFGGSAGGHLSLMIGTTADQGDAAANDDVLKAGNGVKAVAAYFPPVDLRGLTGPNERFPALEFSDDLADDVSPILHVTEDDPPTLLVHGDKDELVPLLHSERIHAAFQEKQVQTKLVVIEGAEHGFRGEHRDTAFQQVADWFDKYLTAD